MASTNSEKQNQKAHLLCVDDDLRFLEVFTSVLEAAGYSVVAASNADKAVDLATSASFDLVILDYDLGDVNGAELAGRLKQNKCDLPVILFSGNASVPQDALKAVDGYVAKGENLGSLLQMLKARILARTDTDWKPSRIGAGERSFL